MGYNPNPTEQASQQQINLATYRNVSFQQDDSERVTEYLTQHSQKIE